jgi:hypothetical protein
MKTVRLNEFWSQRLARLPESGMGYQRVDLTLKDRRIIRNVLVLNAEECQTAEDFTVSDIADIQIHRRRE